MAPAMPDRILAALRRLFAGLAVAFAATGLVFFLFPDGTLGVLNAAGSPLGLAYMVLVTLLAAQIARDPRGRAHLMPLLAAGKATSSLTCAGYFVLSMPAFIYLANALVDGALAAIALGAWAVVWATDAAPAARDAALLRAVLDALVPRGGPFAIGAADADLRQKLLAGPNTAHHAARLAT